MIVRLRLSNKQTIALAGIAVLVLAVAGPILDEIDMHQSVGAEIMMLESEGITEDLPPEE
jgi:hypothetical protein